MSLKDEVVSAMAADSERHDRNMSAVIEAKLDAVICGSASAVLLLSGYWPVMAASIAVLTAGKELKLIVPRDELELAQKTSAAEVIPYEPAGLHTLQSPLERVKDPLQKAMQHMGSPGKRIGTELGEGMQPASYAVGTQFRSALQNLLEALLPKADVVSCDSLLQSLRPVKTSTELKLMQKGCDVVAAGFARAEACIRPGTREAEIAAMVQAAFDAAPLAKDLDRSYGFFFCMSGPNSAKAAGAYARTRQRVVEEGDLVMIHANTCADGYWTDITRTYTAGAPSDKQKDMRLAITEARRAALGSIRPGAKADAVDRAARSVMKAHGFDEAFKHATGHGVGFAAANPNDLPRIHPSSQDVLQAGMTFNVEPAAYFDGYGGMRHCDLVEVTADGVHVLTDF